MTDQQLCVLGSSGSIGVNTLAVARYLDIPVHSISAHNNFTLLIQQAREFHVKRVVISNETHYQTVADELKKDGIEVLAGSEALSIIAGDSCVSTVMSAIVGAAGLNPTLAACRAGKRVCIANKEPLVIAGQQIMDCARQHNAHIIPVDSEHSAIFQCLEHHHIDEVKQILLTGSGGPLRDCRDLTRVSKEQALNHPNWSMGDKITIDSATLMNKGLELIEASHLFNAPASVIDVIIHPQSIVHSMVAFKDGSVAAQLGKPDMRTPIQYALSWPQHVDGPVDSPDFIELGQLEFKAVDHKRFPGINLARHALTLGDFGPCALNAANECAVASFLNGDLAFLDIFKRIESALEKVPHTHNASVDEIIAYDTELREAMHSR